MILHSAMTFPMESGSLWKRFIKGNHYEDILCFILCSIVEVLSFFNLLNNPTGSFPRVTDDIVAMARPSSHLVEKFDIIEQFHR